VSRKGHEINLLNFQLYEDCKNYMVIESITSTTSKTIHVMNFDASPLIKVGRAQVAEVRITDISVSRHHSTLKLCRDGSISLNDNYSKFGTLLLINRPLAIIPSEEGTYLQIGRTMLSL
jgi:pSer/pThr/pTyr-binding forkhead associated (FHA) protein